METAALQRKLEGLLPAIRERREEIERDRKLPRALVHALHDTGLFALEIPRTLGGTDGTPLEIVRAIETVSRADGSTGWCTGLGIANNGVAGFMHEAGAREVFAEPGAPSAGVFAPSGSAVRVDGGARINGRWQFASGISHCDWIWAGCVVLENGLPRMAPLEPEIIYAVMPTRELEIHDTWFASGLCGTASNDISVKDAFVPERRIFVLGNAQQPEPLYRMPLIGWFVSHVAAVALGVARGALDELTNLAQTKLPTFSMAVLADRPVAQVEVARAEAALSAARAFLHETLEDLWRSLSAGETLAARQIALNRVAAANAAEVGASVTRTLSVLAGGGSVFKTSALQRHARDADAIAHHFTVAPHVWEDAGRVLLGRAPNAPMF